MAPTIKDVAQRANVSPSTVSRVLNKRDGGHMRAETRVRVLKAIEELDYTPVKAARTLRRQRAELVAVLLPDISNPFFSLLARGVEAVGFERGYSTLICDSNHSTEKESRHLDNLLAEGVEGIVFVPVAQPEMPRVERLLRHDVEVIIADRRVEGLPAVEADNLGGSYALTEYVLGLGYRKIAYITGPEGVSTAEDRVKGFQKAVYQARITPVTVLRGDFTHESGYVGAQTILSRYEVDAVMCGNDLTAIGVAHAAEEMGIKVPQDLGITGFDNVACRLLYPKLTTVEVPAFEMGSTSFQQLLSGGRQRCVLTVRTVAGTTCIPRR